MKLKITLDRETARLLRLEAFGLDCSLGQVVTNLVRSSPRRFILMDRAKGTQGAEGQGHATAQGTQAPRGEVAPLGLVSEAG